MQRAPWYWGARQQCADHRHPVLAEGQKVIVALGGTALKTLLGLEKLGLALDRIERPQDPLEKVASSKIIEIATAFCRLD